MMDVMTTIKEHPVAIGAGAVVILLLVLRGGGSSGAGNGAAISLQSQALANDANVKLAGINAQASAIRSQYTADMYKAGVAANTALALSQDQSTISAMLGYLGHEDTQQRTAAQLQMGLRQLDTSAQIATANFDTQLAMLETDTNARISSLGQLLSMEERRLDYAGNNLASLLAHESDMAQTQYEFQERNLPTMIAFQRDMADKQYHTLGLLTEGQRAIGNAQAVAINRGSRFDLRDVAQIATNAAASYFTGGMSNLGSLFSSFGGGSGGADSGAVSFDGIWT